MAAIGIAGLAQDDDPAGRRARLPAPPPDGAGGRGDRRLGVVLLMAMFTFSAADPSLNHATGNAPNNLLGLPGAYVSDLLLQTFGLAIVLVPVALITWGVRMLRTHHLGFFGLRLSLLLLALLMMSVACVGLGDVGGAATHTGPGGLVGLALVGRFREIVLTHSSGGSLALIEPVLRGPRLHRHGAGAGHEPHGPAADLPHPARAVHLERLAVPRRRRPVARPAAGVRRGRAAGTARSAMPRSRARSTPASTIPRISRTAASSRFPGRHAAAAARVP